MPCRHRGAPSTTTHVSLAQRTAFTFAAFAVLCASLTGGLVLMSHRRDLDEAIISRHALLTENRALAIREALGLAVEELRRLSHSAVLDPSRPNVVEGQRALRRAYRQSPFFEERMELVRPDGECHLAEPVSADCDGVDHSAESWFSRAIAEREPHLQTYGGGAEKEGESVRLDAIVPIRDSTDQLHGLLRGEIALDAELFDHPTHASLPPHTEALLVDAEGHVLRRGSESTRAWEAAILGAPARASVVTAAAERYLVASAPIEDTDLRMIFAWRWDEVDASAQRRTQQLLGAVGVAALFALALGILLARQLTRPLLALTRDVRRVREKNGGERPSIAATGASGEVGELRSAFAGLVEELSGREDEARAAAATLESRVQERTRALAAARDALLQAERLAVVGRAGAVLSHELRNSLNSINVAIDALGSPSLSLEGQAKVRGAARAEVARLRTLSDTLLHSASPSAPTLTSCRTTEILEHARALVVDEASASRVTLTVEHTDGEVRADSSLMVSVITNLLRNAVQAARANVHVRSRIDEQTWTVSVEDDGPGLPDVVRKHLFEPFSTGRVGGVGLGLSVAHRFVTLHHGQLEVKEPSELGGARFQVTVPLLASRGAPVDAEPS